MFPNISVIRSYITVAPLKFLALLYSTVLQFNVFFSYLNVLFNFGLTISKLCSLVEEVFLKCLVPRNVFKGTSVVSAGSISKEHWQGLFKHTLSAIENEFVVAKTELIFIHVSFQIMLCKPHCKKELIFFFILDSNHVIWKPHCTLISVRANKSNSISILSFGKRAQWYVSKMIFFFNSWFPLITPRKMPSAHVITII